jgi:hypothetical protein
MEPLVDRLRAEQSYREATDPDRVSALAPDVRRTRERQQEEAKRRSAEAEEERRRKAKAERERKRVKSPEEERWEKLGGRGEKLGKDGDGAKDRVVPPAAAAASSDNPWSSSWSPRGGDARAADGMRRRTAGR